LRPIFIRTSFHGRLVAPWIISFAPIIEVTPLTISMSAPALPGSPGPYASSGLLLLGASSGSIPRAIECFPFLPLFHVLFLFNPFLYREFLPAIWDGRSPPVPILVFPCKMLSCGIRTSFHPLLLRIFPTANHPLFFVVSTNGLPWSSSRYISFFLTRLPPRLVEAYLPCSPE